MEVDPTESLQEAGEEHIPEAIPLMASSQAKIHNIREDALLSLPMDTWVDRVCNETQVSREEALYHLEGFKWNWGAAMEACRSKTRPEQPSQLDNKLISSFFNEGFSQEDVSQFQASLGSQNQEYFKEGEIGSPMEVDPTESLQEAGEEHIPEAVPLMASSQVKIQNIREDTLSLPMDTCVDRVCNEIQVSREEALYYLEGFKWNLGAAMEACRSKTLPEQPFQLSEIAQASPNISTTSVSSQAGLDDPSSSSFSDYSSVDKTGAATKDKRLLNLAGNLTFDLVEEILLRVPVTSLARFSMACSRWGSLFRGSRFIYKHLMISQNHFLHSRQSEIWVVNTEAQPSCLKICDFGSETIRSMVQCNGLILCTTVSRRIVLLNCSQTRWIDKENLSLYDFYCLGHDSSKQYFVLRFNFGAFDRNCESYWTMAEILDISSNSWSCVDIEDYLDN